MAVDGTKFFDDSEEQKRITYGPNWKSSSCVADCILQMALWSNLGRLRIDQETPQYTRTLSKPQQLIRRIVACPWGKLFQPERDQLRDEFADSLILYKPRAWGAAIVQEPPDLDQISSIMDHIYDNLAQTCYTTMRVVKCCDDVARYIGNGKLNRLPGFIGEKDGTSIEYSLNRQLGNKARVDETGLCSNKETCLETFAMRYYILDWLPSRLRVVWRTGRKLKDIQACGGFTMLNLRFRMLEGEKVIMYHPVGVLLRYGGSVLTCRYIQKDQVWQYPGFRDNKSMQIGRLDEGFENEQIEVIELHYNAQI